MYSPQEKQQLDQLRAECDTSVETNIKQHEGGYVVTHVTTFLQGDVVQGRVSDTYVIPTRSDVSIKVAILYQPEKH